MLAIRVVAIDNGIPMADPSAAIPAADSNGPNQANTPAPGQVGAPASSAEPHNTPPALATQTGAGGREFHGLELLYLGLAGAGAVLPWLANLDYMRAYPGGFDIGQFIALANSNPAAQSLSRDLAIGSSAVLIWIVVESRRLRVKGLWLVLLCCFTVAFACAAPLFLYLRERRLRELAREAAQA